MSEQNRTSVELAPVAVRTSTFTGTGVDVTQWKGLARVTQYSAAASTGDTLNGKLQCSSDDGDQDAYADITGAVFTEVDDQAGGFQTIIIDMDKCEKFIRYVGTLAGGTISVAFGCMLDGMQAQEP